MEVVGYNGIIQVSDNTITIKRKGVLAFLSQGLKGSKDIYINKISSIQIKNANWLTNGYIQFSFLGGSENKNGIFDAVSDENTVLFTNGQQENFLTLKSFIEKKIEALNDENKTNQNNNDLKLAQRMKQHLNNGKSILEAEALAKMEIVLEKEIF